MAADCASSPDPKDETPAAGADLWLHAPCGLLETDADGHIKEVNATFLEWSGYLRSHLVGSKRFQDLLTPAGRIFHETHLAPLVSMQGDVAELALDIVLADGRRGPALISANSRLAAPVSGGMRIAVVPVAQRRSYERELLHARLQAEEATSVGRRAQRRLRLLADATMALASASEIGTALAGLAEVIVAALGDWCLLFTVESEAGGAMQPAAAAHVDASRLAETQELAEVLARHAPAGSALHGAFTDTAPSCFDPSDPLQSGLVAENPQFCSLIEGIGAVQALIIPVLAHGEAVASVLVGRAPGSDPYGADDMADLSEVSARVGLLIDNIRLHAQDHRVAVALQQALLTEPPHGNGVEIVSRYIAAAQGAQVGGDWFDAFENPDGSTVAVIGDVAGHDIRAAASMGQLRGLLRAIAYTSGDTPGGVLRRTDHAARGLRVDALATAIVAFIEQPTDGAGTRLLRWSNAGHPPPLLIADHGVVSVLASEPDLLLGVQPDVARRDQQILLTPGSTLLFYTDGLVENRRQPLQEGIDYLAELASDLSPHRLDSFCDALVARITELGVTDDIAILALRTYSVPDNP